MVMFHRKRPTRKVRWAKTQQKIHEVKGPLAIIKSSFPFSLEIFQAHFCGSSQGATTGWSYGKWGTLFDELLKCHGKTMCKNADMQVMNGRVGSYQ